jgi:hypothetical protein
MRKFNDMFKVGRVKNEKYLEWLRDQPCGICGRQSSWAKSDPHHVGDNVRTNRGNDNRALPLCRACHGKAHNHQGGKFFSKQKLRELADRYWRKYQGEE